MEDISFLCIRGRFEQQDKNMEVLFTLSLTHMYPMVVDLYLDLQK